MLYIVDIAKCARKTHASVGFDRSRSKGFTALDFAKRFSDAKVTQYSLPNVTRMPKLGQQIQSMLISHHFQANFDPNLITPSEYVEILAKVKLSLFSIYYIGSF